MCLCCPLSDLNLDVPVFCLSLKQPEKGTALSYITGSNLYMSSKNIQSFSVKVCLSLFQPLSYIHASVNKRSLTVQFSESVFFTHSVPFSPYLCLCPFFSYKNGAVLSCKRLLGDCACAKPSYFSFFLPYSHILSINIPSRWYLFLD